MKNAVSSSVKGVLPFLLLAFLVSCGGLKDQSNSKLIQKRKYAQGYYVNVRTAKKYQQAKPKEALPAEEIRTSNRPNVYASADGLSDADFKISRIEPVLSSSDEPTANAGIDISKATALRKVKRQSLFTGLEGFGFRKGFFNPTG